MVKTSKTIWVSPEAHEMLQGAIPKFKKAFLQRVKEYDGSKLQYDQEADLYYKYDYVEDRSFIYRKRQEMVFWEESFREYH
jgi:hypothetical protein